MDFKTAVTTALSKYVTFSGRARRSEYWWFALLQFLVAITATAVDSTIFGTKSDSTGPIYAIAMLGLFLPALAVAVRRLHDIGRTGWWFLIVLVPIVGVIVMLVFTTRDSESDNVYGPSPKYPNRPAHGFPGVADYGA